MVFRVLFGILLNFFQPSHPSQEFCQKDQCHEEDMQLAKSWKIPIWVRNVQKSPVLQRFLELPPPENQSSTEELIEQCKKVRQNFEFNIDFQYIICNFTFPTGKIQISWIS